MKEETAKSISIPIAACVSTFCMWLLCLASPPQPTGHWHIYHTDGSPPSEEEYIQTIDFLPNNSAKLNAGAGGFGGIVGGVAKRERKIYFGGECIYFPFHYRPKKDTLLLRLIHYNKEEEPFYALRCEEGCCNKQDDFFQFSPIRIDLPTLQDSANIVRLQLNSTWMHIKVGPLKPVHEKGFGKEARLVLGHQFSSIDDFPLWQKRNLVKLPEHRRSELRPLLFVDRTTPIDSLKPIACKLSDLGYSICNFALKSADTSHALELWLKQIPIQDLTCLLTSPCTLEDLIYADPK